MTPAWFHAVRAQRLRQGLCPGCGRVLVQGYGLMGGTIGAYTVCTSHRCDDPFMEVWADHEMEGGAPEADCTAAGASTEMTARSPSA